MALAENYSLQDEFITQKQNQANFQATFARFRIEMAIIIHDLVNRQHV